MSGLVLRTIVRNWRVWVSLFVFLALANVILTSVGALVSVADAMPAHERRVVRNLSTPMQGMAYIAVLVITTSAVSLAVRLQRREFAAWKLVGISSARVGWVLVSQLLLLGIAGGVLGLPLGLVFAPALIDWVLHANAVSTIVQARMSMPVMLSSCASIVCVVLLAGVRGISAALRIPAVDALVTTQEVRSRPSASRRILSLVMLIAILAVAAGMVGSASGSVTDQLGLLVGLAMLLSLLVVPLVSLHVSKIASLFLASWTWIVPRRWSTVWYLARRSCGFRLERAGASLVPLYVAVSLASSVYTVFETADSARKAAGLVRDGELGINHSGVWTILGPTVIMAIVGTAAVVVMASQERAAERALLAVGGVGTRSIVGAAIVEAFMYSVTATVLGLMSAGVVSAVEAAAFARLADEAHPTIAILPGLFVGAGGFCVLAAALSWPAVAESRRAAVDRIVL